jgi:hypothetical protein
MCLSANPPPFPSRLQTLAPSDRIIRAHSSRLDHWAMIPPSWFSSSTTTAASPSQSSIVNIRVGRVTDMSCHVMSLRATRTLAVLAFIVNIPDLKNCLPCCARVLRRIIIRVSLLSRFHFLGLTSFLIFSLFLPCHSP